jgi:hypothetical protein
VLFETLSVARAGAARDGGLGGRLDPDFDMATEAGPFL